MSDWRIVESGEGVTFAAWVTPRASRDEVAGVQGDALRLKVSAPPVEGAANAALIEFLAKRLGVRRSAVSIVGGGRSRYKLIRVDGVTREQVEEALVRHQP